ncbi:hypothetical protein C8J57DRAFT_1619097 [Mycena rebaudengoi]|nr:hypothetical protein C8J57DRAFT_1619097 [Mycena rebaudengoi]
MTSARTQHASLTLDKKKRKSEIIHVSDHSAIRGALQMFNWPISQENIYPVFLVGMPEIIKNATEKKPICSNCLDNPRVSGEDCLYVDRQWADERRIEKLEATILDLTSKVKLLQKSEAGISHSDKTGGSSSSKSSSRREGRPKLFLRDLVAPPPMVSLTARRLSPSSPLGGPTVSMEEAANLLAVFTPHAFECGFFLYAPRFVTSVLQGDSLDIANGSAHPSPALVNAVYMWASVFADKTISVQTQFLERSLFHLTRNVANSSSPELLDTLQTELLLSLYFFRSGKVLEAKSRLGSACCLAVHGRLHLMGSQSDFQPILSRVTAHSTETFAIVVQASSTHGDLDDGTGEITTPWPVDMSDPEWKIDTNTSNPITAYISGAVDIDPRSKKFLVGLVTRAFVLFDHSFRYYDGWSKGSPPITFSQLNQEAGGDFAILQRLILTLRAAVPPLDWSCKESIEYHLSFQLCTLLNGATINLHRAHCITSNTSRATCLNAAHDMFALGNTALRALQVVHPAISFAWASACNILALEFDILARSARDGNLSPDRETQMEEIRQSLDCGLAALHVYEPSVPVIFTHSTLIQRIICRPFGLCPLLNKFEYMACDAKKKESAREMARAGEEIEYLGTWSLKVVEFGPNLDL